MVPLKKIEEPPPELHVFLQGTTLEWTCPSIESKELIMKIYDKESGIVLQQLVINSYFTNAFIEEYVKGGLDIIADILEKTFDQEYIVEKPLDRKGYENLLMNNISGINWNCICFYSRFNLDFPFTLWEKIKQRNPSNFKKYIPKLLQILDKIEYITPNIRILYEEFAGYPGYAAQIPPQCKQKLPEGYKYNESDFEKFTGPEWKKKRGEQEEKSQKEISYRHFSIDPNRNFINAYDYDEETRIYMALGRRTCSQEEFKKLFEDESENVIEALAGNPEATKYPEFAKLFTRKNYNNDSDIYTKLAANSEAPKLPQYQMLFYMRYPNNQDYCLRNIASNPNAYKFQEFRNLFYSKDKYIRMRVARNPSSLQLPEFHVLLNDPDEDVRDEAKVTYYMSFKEANRDLNKFFSDKSINKL